MDLLVSAAPPPAPPVADIQEVVVRAWGLQDAGRSEAAWRVISPFVQADPPLPDLGRLYARLAPFIGHEKQALAFLERLLLLRHLAPHEMAGLHMAAATLLDSLGAYARAFDHARLGKQASANPYRRAESTTWTDAQLAYFTPARLHDLPRASHHHRRPVFIIGMPRSGTSLVEQILACHPQVHAAGELQALIEVRRAVPQMIWAGGAIYPFCLDSMGIKQANQLAGFYLQRISALGPGAKYVTDKMPTNFMLLGLIATLFPDSRIIHCRRDPRDTCLSCFMTPFAPGLPFTHDLTDLGCFYRNYSRLMTHWKSEVQLPMIEVTYEELVGDLEGQTRRLLAALDLPWDERCLDFYKNERLVRTASRDQVRRPIYTSSIGRWKHYESHLSPLFSALDSGLLA